MPEHDYVRMARELSRTRFVEQCQTPFIVFGVVADDWTYEFKTRSLGPAGWDRMLSSDDRLHNQTLTDLPVAGGDDDEEDQLGGIMPVRKSSRNPYSDRISVGRAKTCDIILPSPHVSKLHAHIMPNGDGTFDLRDASSANGTFRNGVRLKPDERVHLKPGDKLRFGWLDTQYLDAGLLYDWIKQR